jgi:Zincin-like metallopeptidase
MIGAFVCAALSIVPTVRHDYLGSWLEALREDNRAIIRAASAASKAADYLLAFRAGDPAPEAAEQALAQRGGETMMHQGRARHHLKRTANKPQGATAGPHALPSPFAGTPAAPPREEEGREGICDGFSRARDGFRPPVTGSPLVPGCVN